MNPEENQPQAPNAEGVAPIDQPTTLDGATEAAPEMSAAPEAPVASAAPEAPVTSEAATAAAPILDDDVANAINELANEAAAASGASGASTAPVASTAPMASETPTASETSTAPIAPEAPATPGVPAPDIAAAVTELDADAVIDSIDSPETTPESAIPTKIGVDFTSDGEAAASETQEGSDAKILSAEGKEEEPIKPADPVPGSIGSALKYSASAPDHSEPTEKPKGLKALFARKKKQPEDAPMMGAPVTPEASASVVASEAPVTSGASAVAASETAAPVASEALATPEAPAEAEVPDSFGPTIDVPNPNAAKAKGNSTILALIILGAVVLVGVIVAIIVFIMTSNNNTTTVTTTVNPSVVEPESSSLVCTYTSTANDISRAKNAKLASYELKMIANYADDEMVDMSISGTYNYTDAEAAAEGARQARVSYTRDYGKLNLNSDPFSSNYPVNGNSFTASHFAKIADIDEDNASLLHLSVNSRGAVDTSKEGVQDVFVKRGYTCNGGTSTQGETEEDEYVEEESVEEIENTSAAEGTPTEESSVEEIVEE